MILTKIFKSIMLLLLFSFSFAKCTSIQYVVHPELNDNLYDSEFPYNNSSEQLETINKSIKMISCVAYYQSYLFEKETKVLKNDLTENFIKNNAIGENIFNESVGGTATIVYSNNGKVALLTCAHILDFPDTLITYYQDLNGEPSKFIKTLTYKIKQNNFLPEYTNRVEVEILLIDKEQDIALVGKNISVSESVSYPKFQYPLGKSSELNWGTFVYIFGYPLNVKMITKGIITPPRSEDGNFFLTDAVINRGFSGGIVLAIRDGVPNFEFVGMVKSGSADPEYFLKPETTNQNFIYNPIIPYEGKILMDHSLNIRYGVTKILPIEKIVAFIEENKDKLNEKDYFLQYFFEKKE